MNIYPRKSTYSNTIGLDTMWPISNKEITFAWSSIGSFKYPTEPTDPLKAIEAEEESIRPSYFLL